jgi:hypothetical protein
MSLAGILTRSGTLVARPRQDNAPPQTEAHGFCAIVEGFGSGGIITQDFGIPASFLTDVCFCPKYSIQTHKKAPNFFGAIVGYTTAD